MYGNQARNALALNILGTNGVTRSLGSDHNNVNVCGRNDKTEVNVEAVREHQSFARSEVRKNGFLIKSLLLLIVNEYHNNVGSLCSVCGGHNLKTLLLCFFPAFRAVVKTYYNVYAAVLKVQRVSVSL